MTTLLRLSTMTATIRRRRRLWYRWTLANGVGVVAGVGSGAMIGWALLVALEARTGDIPAALLSAVFFGLIGGALLGAAQHRVLSWPLPFVSLRSWVSATILGGIIAWVGADIPVAWLADESGFLFRLSGAVLLGIAAGVVLGVPQALVLQPQIERAWHWVWANALAWAVAMPIVTLAVESVSDDAGWVRIGFTAVFALAAAGCIAGVIHGRVMVWLVEDRLHPNRYTIRALEGISQSVAGNDGPFN